MRKTDATPAHILARAALTLLPITGWYGLELDSVIRHAKIARKTANSLVKNKNDLVPLIVRFIDEETFRIVGKPSRGEEPEDRAFDVLMSRFEVLQRYRTAILILSEVVRKTPDLALAIYRAQTESMARILPHAPRDKTRLIRFSPHIFLIVYHLAFLKWAQDSSPDLAATMGYLNKIIRTGLVLKFIGRSA